MFRRLIQQFPKLAGANAYRTFCTPRLSTYRSADYDQLALRARVHLRDAVRMSVRTGVGDVQTYVFEPATDTCLASVLLVHGWTGEASFMSAFAEYFRRRGFRVVLLDCPAHGISPGARTSLIACAHAVSEVAEALGPIQFVVAHSMGGLAALLAGEGGPPMVRAAAFSGYVFVALPNRFSDITGKFGREQDLSSGAQRDFESRLERLACREISDFTGTKLLKAVGRPALLMHSRDDEEVAFDDAKEIADGCQNAQMQAFDGLGHRTILYTPDVVRAAARFLERQANDSVLR